MKEFILDVAKWRCGGDHQTSKNAHNAGLTKLLNQEGYSCCLGQCMLQLGASEEEIKDISTPRFISMKNYKNDYNLLIIPHSLSHPFTGIRLSSTYFSTGCMAINDDPDITLAQRVEALRKRFEGHGIKFTVINYTP